jgi:hypothetical protein
LCWGYDHFSEIDHLIPFSDLHNDTFFFSDSPYDVEPRMCRHFAPCADHRHSLPRYDQSYDSLLFHTSLMHIHSS